MATGKGINLDLNFTLRMFALVCCASTLTFTNYGGGDGVTPIMNSFKYATGGYIIILVIFHGYALLKGEIDETFAGCILAFGFIYMISVGTSVVGLRLAASYKMVLIAGILAISGGIVMLIDALKCFKYF